MKRGGTGGANTGTGLRFEKGSSLRSALSRSGAYRVSEDEVRFQGRTVARLLEKNKLYADYLGRNGVDYRTILAPLRNP